MRQLAGRNYWEAYPKLSGPLPDDSTSLGEVREVRLENGQVVAVHSSSARVDDRGHTYIVRVFRDTTAAHHAQQVMSDSAHRLEILAQVVEGILVFLRLPDLSVSFITAGVGEALGFAAERWMLEPDLFVRQLHSEDRERVLNTLRQAAVDGDSFHLDYRLRHEDGLGYSWVEHIGTVERDSQGKAVALLGAWTDHARAGASGPALGEHGRTLATLLGNLAGMMFRCRNDRAGSIEFVSEGCQALTGYTPEELAGSRTVTFAQLIHRDDLDRVWRQAQCAADKGEGYTVEYRLIDKHGVEKWVWESGCSVRDPAGATGAVEGLLVDMSERRRAEQALAREAEVDSALAQLSRAVLAPTSIEELSRQVLDHATRLTESAAGFVAYVGPQSGHLVCPAARGDRWQRCGLSERPMPPAQFHGIWGWVLQQAAPLLSNAPSRDSRVLRHLCAHDPEPVQRFLSVPAFIGTKVVGQIGLSDAPRDYTEQDAALLERLASFYAIALQRQWSEQELRESQRHHQRLVEHAPVAIAIHDAEGRIEFANPAAAQLAGLIYPGQMVGRSVFELVPSEAETRVRGLIEAILNRGEHVREAPAEIHRLDGTTAWVEVTAIPWTFDGARRVLMLLSDLSEFRRTEAELRDSEERFRALSNSAQDAIVVMDDSGRVVFWNEASTRIFGLSPDEAKDKDFAQLILRADYRATFSAAFADFAKSGRGALIGSTVELPALRRDGSALPVEASFSAVNLKGRWHAIGLVRDVSARKQSEQALRESEERYRRLFNNTADAVYVHSLADDGRPGHFIEVNDVACSALGYTREELLSMDVGDICLPAARKGLVELMGQLGGEQHVTFETEHQDRNGQAIPVEVHAHGFELHGRRAVLCVTHNISERRQAELERRDNAERLSSALQETIRAIARTIETRDPYTAGHQQRVAELASAIGDELGLSSEALDGIRLGAMIHDIGKIAVPAEILNRPGRLTAAEVEIIKGHSQVGYDIMAEVDLPWPVADMILQHHERLDGSGYPRGLRGEQIIIEARIIAVADVVEAMASHRPYRPGLGIDSALQEILDGRGRVYDAGAVDACVMLFRERGFAFQDRERHPETQLYRGPLHTFDTAPKDE